MLSLITFSAFTLFPYFRFYSNTVFYNLSTSVYFLFQAFLYQRSAINNFLQINKLNSIHFLQNRLFSYDSAKANVLYVYMLLYLSLQLTYVTFSFQKTFLPTCYFYFQLLFATMSFQLHFCYFPFFVILMLFITCFCYIQIFSQQFVTFSFQVALS